MSESDEYPDGVEPPSEDYDPHESESTEPEEGEEFPKIGPTAKTETMSVTFQNTLPMGTRGTFTRDGMLWIAYPAKKNQQIFTLIDRLTAIYGRINDEMIGWINKRPGDIELVNLVLERVAVGRDEYHKLIHDRIRNATR